MALGRVFYDNVLNSDNYSSVTVNSEQTEYSSTFLDDTNQGTLFKSNGTSNAIVIDFGAAVSIDGASILNTNFGATPTTCKVEANASDSWAGPAYTQTMTAKLNPLTSKYDFYDMPKETYRYWRFNIALASGTVDLGLLQLWTNTYLFTGDFGAPEFLESIVNDEIRNASQSGHIYRDVLSSKRMMSGTFPYTISEAQKTVFDAVQRSDYSLFFPNGTSGEMMYGTMGFGDFEPGNWDNTANTSTGYRCDFSFEECNP